MPQNNPQQFGGQFGYQQPYNPYMTGSSSSQNIPPYSQQSFSQQMPPQPQVPTMPPSLPQQSSQQLQVPPMPNGRPPGGPLVIEQSYIENILRLNRGKLATIYMTFENNKEWNAKVFKGIIEAAGRDHVVLSDPTTSMRYLLPLINLDYVTFEEEIEYSYPLQQVQPPLSTFPPR